MYKFFDNAGRILVLRPDMTIPVARVVTTKLRAAKLPIKIAYSSNVFRVNESLLGRRNEYLDCGLEMVGAQGLYYDLEVLTTAIETIKMLEINNFKLEIGNINILKIAMKLIGLKTEVREKIAELIDRKSLLDLEDYIHNLKLNREYQEFLLALPWLFGEKDIFFKAKEIAFSNEIVKEIEYLEKVFMSLHELGYEENITADIAMVPRLNYYSGIIFRGYVNGIGSKFLSGGRYDNLFDNFETTLPAIGFSIDVDSLVDIYSYKNNINIEVVEIDEIDIIKALNLGRKNVREGKRVRINRS